MLSPRFRPQHPALFLSTLLHPFALIPVTILVLTRDWRTSGLIAAVTVLPMLVVTLVRVRKGTWSNVDVSDRSQRSGLYRIGLPLTLVAGVILAVTGAPAELVRGTAVVCGMLCAGLLLAPLLKTSLHMMFAAYCAVLIAEKYPWSIPVVITLVIALGWSRLSLQRHTLAEVITGGAIGVAGALTVGWAW